MFKTQSKTTKKSKEIQQKIAVIPRSALAQNNIVATLEQAAPYLDQIYIYEDGIQYAEEYTTKAILGNIEVLLSNPTVKSKLNQIFASKDLVSNFLEELVQNHSETGKPVFICLFAVDSDKLKELMSENNEGYIIRPLYIDPQRKPEGYLSLIKKEENLQEAGDLSLAAVNAQTNLMQVLEIKNHLFDNLIKYIAEDFYETTKKEENDEDKVQMIEAHKQTFLKYFSSLNKPLDFRDFVMISFESAIQDKSCFSFNPLFTQLLQQEKIILETLALLAEYPGFMLTETIIKEHIEPFILMLNEFLKNLNQKSQNTNAGEESDNESDSEGDTESSSSESDNESESKEKSVSDMKANAKHQALIGTAISQLELVKFCLDAESNSPIEDLEDARTKAYTVNLLRFPELCANDPAELVAFGYQRALGNLESAVKREHESYKKEKKHSAICAIWVHVSYRLNEQNTIYSNEEQFYIKGGALIKEHSQAKARDSLSQSQMYNAILENYHKVNPGIIVKFNEAYAAFQKKEKSHFIDELKKLFLKTEAESQNSDSSGKEKEKEPKEPIKLIDISKMPLKLQKVILAIQPKAINEEKKKEKNKEKEKEKETGEFNEEEFRHSFQECAFDVLANPELYDFNPQFVELVYEYLYLKARDRIINVHNTLMVQRSLDFNKTGKIKDVKAPIIDAAFKDLAENEYSYQERFEKLIAAVNSECEGKQKRHQAQPIHQAYSVVASIFTSDAPKVLGRSTQVKAYQEFLNKFCDSKYSQRGLKKPTHFADELKRLGSEGTKLPEVFGEFSEQTSTTEYISCLKNYSLALAKGSPRMNTDYKEASSLAYEYMFNELAKGLFVIYDGFDQSKDKSVSQTVPTQIIDLIKLFKELAGSGTEYKSKYEIFGGALQKLQQDFKEPEKNAKKSSFTLFPAGDTESLAKTKAALDELIKNAILEGTKTCCKDAYEGYLHDSKQTSKKGGWF
jgi:hypothetical protein